MTTGTMEMRVRAVEGAALTGSFHAFLSLVSPSLYGINGSSAHIHGRPTYPWSIAPSPSLSRCATTATALNFFLPLLFPFLTDMRCQIDRCCVLPSPSRLTVPRLTGASSVLATSARASRDGMSSGSWP